MNSVLEPNYLEVPNVLVYSELKENLMNKPLTPNEREKLIMSKISSGVYEPRDDVIDAALRLLD